MDATGYKKNQTLAKQLEPAMEETDDSEASAIFADCVDLSTSIGNVFFKHCPEGTKQSSSRAC
jgi:hypothetical protein